MCLNLVFGIMRITFVVVTIIYILYINGLATVKNTRAWFFIKRDRKNSQKISFTSCSGTLWRRLKVKEDKVYEFNCRSTIRKGNVLFKVVDSSKNVVLEFVIEHGTNGEQKKQLDAEQGEKYTMITKLKSASGNYDVSWK